jgi:hypothetical protein
MQTAIPVTELNAMRVSFDIHEIKPTFQSSFKVLVFVFITTYFLCKIRPFLQKCFILLSLKKVLGATASWNLYVLNFLFPKIDGREEKGHYEVSGPQVIL